MNPMKIKDISRKLFHGSPEGLLSHIAHRFGFLLASLLFFTPPLFAWQATVSASGSTTADAYTTANAMVPTLVTNPNGSQSVTGTSVTGAFGDPAINGEDHYADVSGMAFADAGVLRASVSALALNFSHVPNVPPIYYAMGAKGGFGATLQDSVLVTSGTLSIGAPVQLRLTLHMSVVATNTYRVGGDYDLSAYAPGSYYLAAYAGLNAGVTFSFPNALYKSVPTFASDYPLLIDTTVGSTVAIYITLGVSAEERSGNWPTNGGSNYPNNGGSTVDASHTVGVNIDAVTSGLSLSSESGHDYATPVPEPGTWTLLGLGLGLLLLFRKRPEK
jgi:hypothetical protein